MVWLPDWKWRQQQQQRKGKGKGGGGGQWVRISDLSQIVGGGWGKGKSKGDKARAESKKTMDRLSKIDADRKVWVGGLKEGTQSWKKLSKHFQELDCKPTMTELMGKGKTACLAFKTADEASTAIAVVNGSDFDGETLEVDVWTKKEKKERKEGDEPRKPRVKKFGLKKSGGGGGKQPKQPLSKMAEKIKGVDHELKVWVGDLKPTTTWKQVKQHFVDNGCEVDMCDIMKPGSGKACVTFKTADDASTAIATVNATDLDGQTIKVDTWTKLEKS